MKGNFYIVILFFVLINCTKSTQNNDPTRNDKAVCGSCHMEEKMRKATEELEKFDKTVIGYYNQIGTNPTDVIKQTKELIEKVKIEVDSNNVKWNKLGAIYQLRAETFYKIGDYQNSIKEIYNSKENNSETFDVEFPFGDDDLIHLACNYVKLNDFQKAKSYLDKVGKGYYITTFIWANYYEVVGKKNIALDAYIGIKNQKESDHYFYYKDALQRIEELNRPNSKLLTELYYPSNRSDNEICITDNNIIGK